MTSWVWGLQFLLLSQTSGIGKFLLSGELLTSRVWYSRRRVVPLTWVKVLLTHGGTLQRATPSPGSYCTGPFTVPNCTCVVRTLHLCAFVWILSKRSLDPASRLRKITKLLAKSWNPLSVKLRALWLKHLVFHQGAKPETVIIGWVLPHIISFRQDNFTTLF